jgi:hypothetical protein
MITFKPSGKPPIDIDVLHIRKIKEGSLLKLPIENNAKQVSIVENNNEPFLIEFENFREK